MLVIIMLSSITIAIEDPVSDDSPRNKVKFKSLFLFCCCQVICLKIPNFTVRVSLSVFSLVPDLLFDCSRVLEYAKIRIVLQSTE